MKKLSHSFAKVSHSYKKGVSVSAMQPFFKSLCLLPLLQHY